MKFDKIHRCIRDYKLALGRAMGGIFLKTQLHSSYIFGLNYKPFGASLSFNQKRTMLDAFLESQTIPSPLWQDMASELVESSTQAANEILVPSAPNDESVDIVAPPDLPSEAPKSWWSESDFNEFTTWSRCPFGLAKCILSHL